MVNLIIAQGEFRSNGNVLVVIGNWSNSGTYTSGTSQVIFSGINQSISGSNTFYVLTKQVSTARTLTIEAGSTQTITNALTLTGTGSSTKLSLVSSSPGTQWSINASGTRTLQYLNVQDSNNINASVMAAGSTSVDSGNNTNWSF